MQLRFNKTKDHLWNALLFIGTIIFKANLSLHNNI